MTDRRTAARPSRLDRADSLPERADRRAERGAERDAERDGNRPAGRSCAGGPAGGVARPTGRIASRGSEHELPESAASGRSPRPERGLEVRRADNRRHPLSEPGSSRDVPMPASRREARRGEDDADLVHDLAGKLGAGASRWLDEARLAVVDGHVELRVGSAFVADLINRHHRLAMDEVAAARVGTPGGWRLVVDATLRRATESPADPHHRAPSAVRRRTPIGVPAERHLSDFVVGATNRTAHAAAVRLAEGDASEAIRTLFLHGECGVGKTHLILGLCAGRQRNFPEERIRYTTGEQFTNEFLHHLRHATLDQFRQRMRRVDLLAIDDVHFLAGKSRTSSELLHTLDAIGLEGKRVVIASDGHPEQIRTFSHALRSRLSAGLVVRIDLPDRTLREQLVRRLATRRGLPMTDAAVGALVNRCPGSARELEGALNMLAALRSLDGHDGPIGHLLVDRMFEHADDALAGPVRPATILEAVCDRLGIARTDPLGNGRSPRVVLARAVFTHLCREMTSLSFPEIARVLHRRTHSTVHAAGQRMERLAKENGPVLELGDEPGSGDPLTMLDLLDQIRRAIRRNA